MPFFFLEKDPNTYYQHPCKIKVETSTEAKFKDFEPRLKFVTRLKYGWFHLNCIKCFKIYAGAQLKPVFDGFECSNSLNSDSDFLIFNF